MNREIVQQIVNEWIRDHTSLATKMTQNDWSWLVNRIAALLDEKDERIEWLLDASHHKSKWR